MKKAEKNLIYANNKSDDIEQQLGLVVGHISLTDGGFKIACNICDPPNEFYELLSLISHIQEKHLETERTLLKSEDAWKGDPHKDIIQELNEAKSFQPSNVSCNENNCNVKETSLKEHSVEVEKNSTTTTLPNFCSTFETTSKNRISKKVKKPSEKRIFQCTICSATLGSYHNLKTHMQRHTGIKPYTCQYCSSSFHEKLALKNHMFTHTGECKLKCDSCHEAFGTSQKLWLHRRRVHPYLIKSKKTADNNSTNDRSTTLPPKEKSKDDKQNEETQLFDKITSSTLVNNVTVNETHYRCKLCSSILKSKGTFEIHLLRHKVAKNYKCEHCSRSFYTTDQQKSHMKSHAAEYYECEKCKTPYRDINSLREHIMSSHGYDIVI